MKSISPYLNFNGNSEEAFTFYKSVFGGEFSDLLRFGDMGDTMGVREDELKNVAHVGLPLANGTTLMATDVVPSMPFDLVVGNNYYIHIETDSAEEARTLFMALSDGGRVEMELENTGWSELYGSCVDRFGVQWMVDFTGNALQA